MKKVLAVLLAFVFTLGTLAAVAEGSDYTELSKGDKGDAVVRLQERLNELGYSVGTVDGDYGGKTEAAVRQFQTDHGLSATGIADPATQEALFADTGSTAEGEAEEVEAEDSTDETAAVIAQLYDTEQFGELTEVDSTLMSQTAEQSVLADYITENDEYRGVALCLSWIDMLYLTSEKRIELFGTDSLTVDDFDTMYVSKMNDNIISIAFKIYEKSNYLLIVIQDDPFHMYAGRTNISSETEMGELLEETHESVFEATRDSYTDALATYASAMGWL